MIKNARKTKKTRHIGERRWKTEKTNEENKKHETEEEAKIYKNGGENEGGENEERKNDRKRKRYRMRRNKENKDN